MPEFSPFLNLYKPGGGSSGTILPDEVVDIDRINQNSDLIDAWAASVDAIAKRLRDASLLVAKICKTNNFQAIPTSGAAVTGMVSRILEGGFTYNATSRILTVPRSGMYEVSILAYGSGADTNNVTLGFSATSVSAPDQNLPIINLNRTSAGVDERQYISAPVRLDAGAQLRLIAVSQAGSPNIYGGGANQGAETNFSVRAISLDA